MINAAISAGNKTYSLIGASCIDLVSDALEAGRLNPGKESYFDPMTGLSETSQSAIPNERYRAIKLQNKG